MIAVFILENKGCDSGVNPYIGLTPEAHPFFTSLKPYHLV